MLACDEKNNPGEQQNNPHPEESTHDPPRYNPIMIAFGVNNNCHIFIGISTVCIRHRSHGDAGNDVTI